MFLLFYQCKGGDIFLNLQNFFRIFLKNDGIAAMAAR